MRCPHCNSKLKKNVKFCPECGMAVIWDEVTSDICEKKHSKGTGLLIIALILIAAAVITYSLFGGMDVLSGDPDTSNLIPIESMAPMLTFLDDPTAISEASQSVVKLNCYDKSGELYATGSGFACFAENVIVTNYHVIEGGVYSIRIKTEDGYTYYADTILALDADKDLAILQTNKNHDLKLLQLDENSKIEKGASVVAIGSPLGLLNTVSTGVFSGSFNQYGVSVFQFTAPISSGSSGGALFNEKGAVIGVTSASYTDGQNLNLAIPAKYVCNLYETRSNPIAVSDWFEENDGGNSYLNDSLPVNYQDLLNTPKEYHKMLISVRAYVAEASSGDGLYLLPSEKDITWEGEPYGVIGEEKFLGYMFFRNFNSFEETKMIFGKDNAGNLSSTSYFGKSVTVTGWFEYDDEYSDTQATIKLLHISEE